MVIGKIWDLKLRVADNGSTVYNSSKTNHVLHTYLVTKNDRYMDLGSTENSTNRQSDCNSLFMAPEYGSNPTPLSYSHVRQLYFWSKYGFGHCLDFLAESIVNVARTTLLTGGIILSYLMDPIGINGFQVIIGM